MAQPIHADAAIHGDHFEIKSEALALLEREVDELKAALASRTTIGIALGIIIEREHVTEREAFQILKKMSQHSNVKLRDVAAQIAKDAQATAG
jgi:AmiR/NasT family two-component response regulator